MNDQAYVIINKIYPMPIPRSTPHFLLCFFLSILLIGSVCGQDENGAGAFIIVSKEGDVTVLNTDGKPLPGTEVAAGKTLFEGQSVKTGDAGKIILLLSNGSLTTLTPKSELILAKFKQKAFEVDPGKMVKELEAEPSTSQTKLKLGYGKVVFNVKKLNPGSSFEIDSPIGLAGIRGTDGSVEVQVDPDTGNYTGGVNMLSGNIDFTSPNGQTQNVGAGQGVQTEVNSTGDQVGDTQQTDVPPETTQELTEATNTAEESSEDVSVGELNNAVEEVEQKIEDAPPAEEPKEEETTEEEPKEETETTEETTTEETTEQTEETVTTTAEETTSTAEESTDQLLQTDDQADLAQQGIITESDEDAEKIQSLGLDKEELEQLSKLDEEELGDLLEEEDTEQLLDKIDDVVQEGKAEDAVANYTDTEQATLDTLPENLKVWLLANNETDVVKAILALGYTDEELAAEVEKLANEAIVDLEPDSSVPDIDPDQDGQTQTALEELQELLSENTNNDILDELLEMGGGVLDDTLIELGKQTNELLSDTEPVGTLDPDRIFHFSELFENPFYQDPVFLAESFFDDVDLLQSQAYASRNITLKDNLDLSSIYETGQQTDFAITAKESISLEGVIQWDPGNPGHETSLSILSADTLNIGIGTELNFQGDHLHLGSWGSMEIVNVSMDAGKSLEIQTLEDLLIRDSSLLVNSGDEIHLMAATDLTLNGVNFSNNLREIYMQATTIDLQHINFPGGSIVNMATLYGGIDGKYPTFPGESRQIGRVNFIENVKYNQNLLNTRAHFDQFGQNINISIIQP